MRYRDLAPTVRRGLALVLCAWATGRLVAGDSAVAHVAFADAHLLADELGDVRLRTRAAVGAALVDVVHGEILSAARWLETLDADSRTVLDAEPALATFAAATRALVAIGRLDLRSPDLEGLLGAEAVVDEARSLVGTVRLLASLVRGERDPVAEGDEPSSARNVPGDPDDLCRDDRDVRTDRSAARSGEDLPGAVAARAGSRGGAGVHPRPGTHRIPRRRLRPRRCARASGSCHRAVRATPADGDAPRPRRGGVRARSRAEATAAARDALAACTASGLVQYLAYTPREVLRGLSTDAPGLADALDDLETRGIGDILPAPRVVAELSEREREVLETLATSDSLGAVARRLYLTNTGKTHLRSIYRKLGTHSAPETVQRAVECDLIESPQG